MTCATDDDGKWAAFGQVEASETDDSPVLGKALPLRRTERPGFPGPAVCGTPDFLKGEKEANLHAGVVCWGGKWPFDDEARILNGEDIIFIPEQTTLRSKIDL